MLLNRSRVVGTAVLISLLLYMWSFTNLEETVIEEVSELDYDNQYVKYYSLQEIQPLIVNSTINITYQSSPEAELSYNLPSILHFLWLGSNISQEYINNIKQWASNNKHYQIFLWLDNHTTVDLENAGIIVKDVTKEIESFASQDIILAEPLLVCKADIIRYEIIYKYGGIYSDTDSLSIQPLGALFQHSFVSLMSSPPHYVQNCIFGFPPLSHFLKYVLDLVREHSILSIINKMEVSVKYGPVFFTTAFAHFGDNSIHVIDGKFLLEASGDSVVVQMFDGNWWDKKDEKEEEKDLALLLINKDKERLQDVMDDLQYELDMDESYEKIKQKN